VYRLSPVYQTRAAYSAAVVMALNPMMLHASSHLLREAFVSVLITTTIMIMFFAWRRRQSKLWLLSGIGFASSVLVRTEAILVLAACCISLLYLQVKRKQSAKIMYRSVSLMILFPIIVLIAWAGYINHHFGVWSLGPDSDIGPIHRTVAIASMSDNTKFIEIIHDYGIDLDGSDISSITYGIADIHRGKTGHNWIRTYRELRPLADEYLVRFPLRWVSRGVYDAVNMSLGYSELEPYLGEYRQNEFEYRRYSGLIGENKYGLFVIYIFSRFCIGTLVLLGFTIAAVSWIRKSNVGVMLFACVFIVVLTTSANGTYIPRVRAAYEPILITGAVVGWAIAISWVKEKVTRRRSKAAQVSDQHLTSI